MDNNKIINSGLPQGWTLTPLENLLDYIQPTKYIVSSTDYNDKYKTPVLTPGKSFILGYTDETHGVFDKLPAIIFDDFTTAIKWVNFPFKVKSSAIKILVPTHEEVNMSFVYYFMQTLRLNTDTHKRYWISVGAKCQVPLPPKAEQARIVEKLDELFSELDKGVEQLKTAQQQLKIYRQSLLKAAFEGKLNHSNIKEDELPSEWVSTSLGEVCEVKRGKSKHRPRNEPSLFGGKYPFIQTGDIRDANGGYLKQYSQTYSEKGLQQSKLWPAGTLCITIAANIGETAILNFDACFPDSVVGLISKENSLLTKYLNYFFISYKSRLEELAPATAQKNINVDILEKISIPLAPINEQTEIIEELERKLTLCRHIEESINLGFKQAEVLRQSILKQAFEGRLVNVEKQDAKVISLYKPKNEYFYQLQVLGLIAKASKQNKVSHGEMTLAKYAYLTDKLFDVPTFYDYQRWHLGPFPPIIKKVFNNKQYFKKVSGELEVLNEKKLFKAPNPYQQQIEDAVTELTSIFSKYEGKERAHKTELLATVCKVIEDVQTTDLKAVRASMVDWKIDLKGEKHKTKAEKFTEAETKKCLAFLKEKGWDKKLFKTQSN